MEGLKKLLDYVCVMFSIYDDFIEDACEDNNISPDDFTYMQAIGNALDVAKSIIKANIEYKGVKNERRNKN